jgi:uncharacterized protein
MCGPIPTSAVVTLWLSIQSLGACNSSALPVAEVFGGNEIIRQYDFSMTDDPWRARWTREQRRATVLEQFNAFRRQDTGLRRTALADVLNAANSPHVVVISGLRRTGKSTLLAQLARTLGDDSYYYVNFEDERFLNFGADDANDLLMLLAEVFGDRHVLIIDEIQNVPGWERFVRRFMDTGLKLYVTGSNASLLSRELGNRLTGRYVPIELLPFSFSEFLEFQVHAVPDLDRQTTMDAARLQSYLAEYLRLGGIPDAIKYPELPIARTLYDDVLYRDIVARYRIAEVRALKELTHFLMSNPAGPVSFNKLKEQLQLGSVNTVKNYIEYLANSWLLFTVNVYDYSVKRQQVAPKKIYAIDTGLAQTVGFSFSPNTGRLLENLVFLALRRRSSAIYYLASRGGYEVDFYLPESGELIQVAHSMDQPATREREVRALADAMQDIGADRGVILTDSSAESILVDTGVIEVRSVATWLLEGLRT